MDETPKPQPSSRDAASEVVRSVYLADTADTADTADAADTAGASESMRAAGVPLAAALTSCLAIDVLARWARVMNCSPLPPARGERDAGPAVGDLLAKHRRLPVVEAAPESARNSLARWRIDQAKRLAARLARLREARRQRAGAWPARDINEPEWRELWDAMVRDEIAMRMDWRDRAFHDDHAGEEDSFDPIVEEMERMRAQDEQDSRELDSQSRAERLFESVKRATRHFLEGGSHHGSAS